MTVTDLAPNEILTVRVYKTYAGYSWANTYEVRSQNFVAAAYTVLQDLANRFTTLESSVHLPGVIIDRVVVSTYVPDGEPYNPSSFVVFPQSISATSTIGGDVAPLELCLYVRKNVESGRFGRLFYRAALTEDSIISPAFRPQITNPARNYFNTQLAIWFGAGGPGPGFELVMARGRPNPTDVRVVSSLSVEARVVVKQIRNRYFDIP